MALRNYYLGCPGWGTPSWVGRLFPPGTKPRDFLARYAEVFNTVEGNTTFYALPTTETVARWGDQVPDTFRFCFKFPRTISHDRLLADSGHDVATFLERIAPLGGKLGTLFLQLPPHFGPALLERLRAFLTSLPRQYPSRDVAPRYGVELRHPLFFAGGTEQAEAVALLRELDVDLVIMDARGLHAGETLEVRARKPNLPVLVQATATRPLVRCVPHEAFEPHRGLVEPWAEQLATWIAEGKQPYFFMHAPDDTFAPQNAYRFHAMLRTLADVGDLPAWRHAEPRQLDLL